LQTIGLSKVFYKSYYAIFHPFLQDKKKAENLLFLMKWIKKSALIYKEEKNNNRHS
jgi:hypothetical protein